MHSEESRANDAVPIRNEPRSDPMTATKWQLAREAFHRRLPVFLEQGLRGQWALYRGAEFVEIGPNRKHLFQRSEQLGIPASEIYVDQIMPLVDDVDADLAMH
jgi:hypothetical protein